VPLAHRPTPTTAESNVANLVPPAAPLPRVAGRIAALRASETFAIRPAELTDYPALATLSAAAFAQGLAMLLPRELRARADAPRFSCFFAATPGPLLLAEIGGVPVGCALATPPTEADPARLLGLWVAPAAAGQGIGSALLTASEAALLSLGAPGLRVRVPSGHLRALGLFRRRGYTIQAAGLRTEPVLEAMLRHSVLSKRLVATTAVAA
jgi:GNAT superfamily N-acetyltransferase